MPEVLWDGGGTMNSVVAYAHGTPGQGFKGGDMTGNTGNVGGGGGFSKEGHWATTQL